MPITKKPVTATAAVKRTRRNIFQDSDWGQEEDNLESGAEDVDAMDVDETEHSQSQSSEENDALRAAVKVAMQTHNHKHDIARATVHKEYDQFVADTKKAIGTLFYEHEAEASQIHATNLAHLQRLLREKAEIEAVMAKKVVKLRDHHQAHALDVQRILEERARQMG